MRFVLRLSCKILILVFLFPIYVVAKTQNVTCSLNGYTVVTINGINNDEKKAVQNRDALKQNLPKTYKSESLVIEYLYNPTHGKIFDILDASNQKYFEQKSFNIQDSDFAYMLTDASSKVKTQKLLLVGHSQGNFYANAFYDTVADAPGGVPSTSIRVYGIATPASYVAGGGKYITSNTDSVIDNLRISNILNILPANVNIALPTNYVSNGHSLPDIYLKYQGDRIISEIKSELNDLKNNSIQKENAICIDPPKLTLTQKIQGTVLAVIDPVSIPAQKAVADGAVGLYKFSKNVQEGYMAFINKSGGMLADTFNFGNSNNATVVTSNHTTENTSPKAEPNNPLLNPKNLPTQNTQENIKSNTKQLLAENTKTGTLETPVNQSINKQEKQPQERHRNGSNNDDDSSNEGGNDVEENNDPESVLDTTPPIITITGNNPVNINLGDAYTDEGATAEDNVDGTVDVVVTGVSEIDTSIIGDYQITYTATDLSGNAAIATRTVNVIDINIDTSSNILYSQPDNSIEIGSNITAFDSFTGASGKIQSIKFAYNDHGNSTGHFIGVAVVDRSGSNYYSTTEDGTCGDAYESTGVNAKIIVELDSAVHYKENCTGPELVLDPTHTYGISLFRNQGGQDTQKFYGSSNENDSVFLYITDDRFPSTGKAIKKFGFSALGSKGIINENNHTIEITVPFGTDVTTLTPTIKISGGATINPDISDTLDFTNPVIYTVTAENGLSQDYTVTVNIHSNVIYSQLDNSTEITGGDNIKMVSAFTGAMGHISNLKFSYNPSGNFLGHFMGVQIVDENTFESYYVSKAGLGCGSAYESNGSIFPIIVELDDTYEYKQFPCTGPNLFLDPTHTYGVNVFRNSGGINNQRLYGSSSSNDDAYLYIETDGASSP